MVSRDEVSQIRNRAEALAWWRQVMCAHPGGVVPIATASRILGVTPTRVHGLIREGRLLCIEGMPHGGPRDRFVPIDQLISAPFAANKGRPQLYGPRKRYKKLTEIKRILTSTQVPQ